jgi:glyoxylase-like metal-dependent hydrolase (beta-lactamase superfamily II)
MSPKALSDMPEERKAFAAGAKRQLMAAKDQIKTVRPGADIVTGVRVLDTAGHTPGHISLEVGTGNDRILVVGDALTHPVIAFEHPDWVPGGDQDGAKAAATRKSLLGKLASEGQRIIGYHLPTPGFGRCVKRGTGFAFEAVKA